MWAVWTDAWRALDGRARGRIGALAQHADRTGSNAGGLPAKAAAKTRPKLPRRLSTRLVWATMISVMIAEVLIFVPSLANFRKEWLHSKIETVAVASFAAGQGDEDGVMLTPEGEAQLLRALDAELIAVDAGGTSRLLARSPEVSTVDREVDLERESVLGSIAQAFDTLAFGERRALRVLGDIGDGSMRAEAVISERPLRRDMLAYARELLVISLLIAGFVGLLMNIAINHFLLRPIRGLTQAMIRFAEQPEDPTRIVPTSGRDDEIGIAEAELARMQAILARTLRERRHLADLGLAVSKINHDLRNTLASAQLVSDRMSDIPDPQVQRFAPTLIRSLDRALFYTRSVLNYGRAVEETPVKRRLRLFLLVEEIFDTAATRGDSRIELVNAVPDTLEVDVDPDQFHRALSNLVRNAMEAVESNDSDALVRRVEISATLASSFVTIGVEDTGPGLSEQARATLFQAFRGSTRAGGTGLGLAIAAEIVEAHGGRIRYRDDIFPGARFEIEIPYSAARDA